jgi:TonB family protein
MIDSMAAADKSWVSVSLCLLLTAMLCACSSPPRKPGAAHGTPVAQFGHRLRGDPSAIYLVRAQRAPPPPLSPFADAPVSFLVHGNFARGEQVVVRVCLRPDHSIASSDILESSGDPRFDERALDWARLVQLRAASAPGRTIAPCGPVRVELHDTGAPGMGHQVGEGLG